MTVGELRSALRGLPKDMRVVMQPNGFKSCPVLDVLIFEESHSIMISPMTTQDIVMAILSMSKDQPE